MSRKVWREFRAARQFARSLGLMNQNEWYAYARGDLAAVLGRRPEDIPWNPPREYRGLGWAGMRDWLGPPPVQPVVPGFLTFPRARAFARSLGFTSPSEWRAWCRGERGDVRARPGNVPAEPDSVYPRAWRGWPDWLGVVRSTVAPRSARFLPFDEAREVARALEFDTNREWRAWSRSGARPRDVPANPDTVYLHRGWLGWGDWLGTGATAASRVAHPPYDVASRLVQSLGLGSTDEYQAWLAGERPDLPPPPAGMPSNPHRTYRDSGWTTSGEFLGTGYVAAWKRPYLPYDDAAQLARDAGIENNTAWRSFARDWNAAASPGEPLLPVTPETHYGGKGQWDSWGEFLGNGVVATALRTYRSFEAARAFVRSLRLRSNPQWRAYLRGEVDGLPPLPDDIPHAPDNHYRDHGWLSWPDFLGTAPGKPRRKQRRRRGSGDGS